MTIINIYAYVKYVYMCIYIYIYRERGRSCISIYIYIYIPINTSIVRTHTVKNPRSRNLETSLCTPRNNNTLGSSPPHVQMPVSRIRRTPNPESKSL